MTSARTRPRFVNAQVVLLVALVLALAGVVVLLTVSLGWERYCIRLPDDLAYECGHNTPPGLRIRGWWQAPAAVLAGLAAVTFASTWMVLRRRARRVVPPI